MRSVESQVSRFSNKFELFLKSWGAILASQKVVLLLIILNLCITVPLSAKLNIWFDEAYALDTSSKDLGYAIHQAIHFEEQAPLYFMLLNIWRSFNSSIFFARLFSCLCISATIYIAVLISKKLFENIHPRWIATAIALNPFVIWAAVEIRLFAFSILLSAVALLLFFHGYLNPSPRFRWLHAFVAIIALYTHYFLVFLFAAQAIALLCLNRRRDFLSYCLHMVAVGASFIPMLLLTFRQSSSWSDNAVSTASSNFSIIENIRFSFASTLLYLLPAEIGDSSPNSFRLLRLLFLLFLCSLAFLYRRSINSKHLGIWITTFSLSLIFFILFEVFTYLGINDAVQHYRHTIPLLIPALFSVIAVFSLILCDRTRRNILLVWLSFTLLLNLTSIYLTYAPLAKHGDYIRVASYLMKNEIKSQPILVFNPEVEMALGHYYNGVNSLISLPEKERFETYDLDSLTLKNEQQILDVLSKISDNYQSIWLVTDRGAIEDQPAYIRSYQVLDAFMNKHYSVQFNKDFYGSNVKMLQPAALN